MDQLPGSTLSFSYPVHFILLGCPYRWKVRPLTERLGKRAAAFFIIQLYSWCMSLKIITKKNFQQRISWLSHRWRTQRNAISNVNCRIQWIIESLNASCALWYSGEHVCLSVVKSSTLQFLVNCQKLGSWVLLLFPLFVKQLARKTWVSTLCGSVRLDVIVYSLRNLFFRKVDKAEPLRFLTLPTPNIILTL